MKSIIEVLTDPRSLYKDVLHYKKNEEINLSFKQIAVIFNIQNAIKRYLMLDRLSVYPIETMNYDEFILLALDIEKNITNSDIKNIEEYFIKKHSIY